MKKKYSESTGFDDKAVCFLMTEKLIPVSPSHWRKLVNRVSVLIKIQHHREADVFPKMTKRTIDEMTSSHSPAYSEMDSIFEEKDSSWSFLRSHPVCSIHVIAPAASISKRQCTNYKITSQDALCVRSADNPVQLPNLSSMKTAPAATPLTEIATDEYSDDSTLPSYKFTSRAQQRSGFKSQFQWDYSNQIHRTWRTFF